MRTSTPSSGYSSAAISRTSSFSSEVASSNNMSTRQRRLASADDSAYSEVYSTIEELSELPDPFDEKPDDAQDNDADDEGEDRGMATLKAKHPFHKKSSSVISCNHDRKKATSKSMSSLSNSGANVAPPSVVVSHKKTKSSTSLLENMTRHVFHNRKTRSSTSLDLPDDIAPPLPPRTSKGRPPAMPPYPSSLVRAIHSITKPLSRIGWIIIIFDYDPLCQTHSPASSNHYSWKVFLFCEISDGRTDDTSEK